MSDIYASYAVLGGIAMSFAGFGTIAISLNNRAGGDDSKVDAHRLTNMLAAALTLVVVALLPALLASFGVPLRWQTGLPGLAVIGVMAVAAPGLARRSLALTRAPGYSWWASATNLASVIVAALAFLSCGLGWPGYRPEAMFLLSLMGLLLSSVIMFSRVAMSLLLPHNVG